MVSFIIYFLSFKVVYVSNSKSKWNPTKPRQRVDAGKTLQLLDSPLVFIYLTGFYVKFRN